MKLKSNFIKLHENKVGRSNIASTQNRGMIKPSNPLTTSDILSVVLQTATHNVMLLRNIQ